MQVKNLRTWLLATTLGALSTCASAYPGLQLGILGASYNTTTETSVAGTPTFTLYAFLTPKGGESVSEINALLADTYYVSAALTPANNVPSNKGSFSFTDGTNVSTVLATSGMVYGTPPLDALLSGGDVLQTHGIFPTWFKEFSFKFGASDRVDPIDVQTNATLAGLNFNNAGAGYYHEFQVDVSQLSSLLHFDLYNEEIRQCGHGQNTAPCDPVVYDLAKAPYGFAPFSHDAESGTTHPPGGSTVPEPASLLLVASALGLLAWQTRSRGHATTA